MIDILEERGAIFDDGVSPNFFFFSLMTVYLCFVHRERLIRIGWKSVPFA